MKNFKIIPHLSLPNSNFLLQLDKPLVCVGTFLYEINTTK